MFAGIVEKNLNILKFLEIIKTDEITPYNRIELTKDERWKEFIIEIFEALDTYEKVILEMMQGEYKWEKNCLAGTWKYTLKEFFLCFNELPETQVIDLVEIFNVKNDKTLQDYLTPLSIKILIES